MTRTLTLTVLLAGSALASVSIAQAPAAPAASHTMVAPADLKFTDGPPGLPPGIKVAVLHGDPRSPGLYVARAQLPANYTIPPHWHPADETVTVVSGTIMMGMGDKLDPRAAQPIAAGGFAAMPAKTTHFLITKGPAVIQMSAVGPFAITYVNPADDPRNGRAAGTRPAQK